MKSVHLSIKALLATAAFGLVASSALAITPPAKKAKKPEAQTVAPATSPNTMTQSNITIRDPNKTSSSRQFQFDVKSRWGLVLDVNQPPLQRPGVNDVDAGAYFRLSPSVRVGGSVGIGEKTKPFQPTPSEDQKKQPRVRLETQFKF